MAFSLGIEMHPPRILPGGAGSQLTSGMGSGSDCQAQPRRSRRHTKETHETESLGETSWPSWFPWFVWSSESGPLPRDRPQGVLSLLCYFSPRFVLHDEEALATMPTDCGRKQDCGARPVVSSLPLTVRAHEFMPIKIEGDVRHKILRQVRHLPGRGERVKG
jgi:hypothetical protein